jgi:hypothetical protein
MEEKCCIVDMMWVGFSVFSFVSVYLFGQSSARQVRLANANLSAM